MPQYMDPRIALGSPPPLPALREAGDVALFLDFDGTLVELASGPDAIAPLEGMDERLARLSDRLGGRCAIVSGRAISDIERHIGTLPIASAGSHGSDIRLANGEAIGEGAASLPKVIEDSLRAFAAREGLDYEHKPHGGALHYRGAPASGPKAHAFADELAAEHGWAVQSGKCVAELVAKGANKGGAVLALMQTAPFAGARPIFLGDDLTDEAGFDACNGLGGAGVLVGSKRDTSAHYQLPDVKSVHQWLEL